MLIIRILDPSEVDLKLERSSMVKDLETGREIYVDPQAAASDYRQRFDVHQQQLIDICHRRAARLVTVTIDQPLDYVLLELISNSATLSAAAGRQTDTTPSVPKRVRR